MAVPYLLSGMFVLYEVSSGDEKGIDFYQRGFLRLWCFHSPSLEVAKKYIIAKSSLLGSLDAAAFFSRRSLIFQRQGRTKISSSTFKKEVEDFSQRLGKTGRFFRYLQSRSAFSVAKRNILHELFFPDESKVEVVRRCLWSGILNPPDDFFQLSFLKTLLSRTEAASRSLPSLGKTRGLLLWPNFNHWGRENAGTEVTFSFFWLGCCSGAFYILGSAGFLIRMVSNK